MTNLRYHLVSLQTLLLVVDLVEVGGGGYKMIAGKTPGEDEELHNQTTPSFQLTS